jgi:lipopolysaccharide export system protein LptA
MKVFTAVIALLTFLTVSAAAQQASTPQMTLSFRSLTVSADKLSFDSENGVGKATGNVKVQVDGHLTLSSDNIELMINRTMGSVDAQVSGQVIARLTKDDGTVAEMRANRMRFQMPLD